MTNRVSNSITVVIPVRNRRELLYRALRSVALQSVPVREIIVVDDASDELLNLPKLGLCIQPRVVRSESPVGAQRARLIGAAMAQSTYVALLDSDDWWSPDKLEKQLQVLALRPAAVVSCRVFAIRGSMQKPAPKRPLEKHERVEDFLYVQHGMLQTSTLVARTETVVGLLQASADARVHNDTMLFLEAQRLALPIVQIAEPMSYFDDNPRLDRVSYDAGRVVASEAWFRSASAAWSVEARRGFMLTDMVTRYVNTGQRRKAFGTLLRAFHPRVGAALYFKKFLLILFNGPPLRFLRYER